MITFDHYKSPAHLLEPVKQCIRIAEIINVIRLRHAEGRWMYGELSAVQQITNADDEIRAQTFRHPTKHLQCPRVLVRDKAPISVVLEQSRHRKHVNGWVLCLRESFWRMPGVKDITNELQETQYDEDEKQ